MQALTRDCSDEACSACHVLQAQVEHARRRADGVVQEAEQEELARREAEEALRAARFTVEELKRQRYVIEMRSNAARDELEERRAAQRKAAENWEGEVSAWRVLCADLKKTASDSSARVKECVEQRDAASKETSGLEEKLRAAKAEVGRLHAVQSTLEVQRLQDADRSEREVQEWRTATIAAHERAALGREARDTTSTELEIQVAEVAALRDALQTERVRRNVSQRLVDE